VASSDELQTLLQYRFQNRDLLLLALTHPSVAHEQGTSIQHNQRLEFLGDAVLQLVLTRFLYESFPGYGEGPLTKARAQLVNRRTLAEQALRLNLGEYLLVSRGEELNGGRARPSALADAFEAVLGAIFLDGGYAAVHDFILEQFDDVLGELKFLPNLENPKGELQETLQAQSPAPIEYQLESVTGPDHNRVFECAVRYRGEELGRGKGKSKKEAESQAALAALEQIKKTKDEPAPETGAD